LDSISAQNQKQQIHFSATNNQTLRGKELRRLDKQGEVGGGRKINLKTLCGDTKPQ